MASTGAAAQAPLHAFRVKLGAVVPDVMCETAKGKFTLGEFLARPPAWTMLFSYAGDFSPVAATELAQCRSLLPSFEALGIKVGAISTGSAAEHEAWTADVLAAPDGTGFMDARSLIDPAVAPGCGCWGPAAPEPAPAAPAPAADARGLDLTLIADPERRICEALGILDPVDVDAKGKPVPSNVVFFVGPDRTVRLANMYPARVGRDFREVLRSAQGLTITRDFILATPVNWKEGDRLIVGPGMSLEDAQKKYGQIEVKALPSGKPYLRFVDPPKIAPAPGVPPTGPDPAPLGSAAHFRIMLGAEMPDLPIKTTQGEFSFHAFLAKEPHWTLMVSHPKDFTPVCTTELAACQSFLVGELAKRGIKLIGLSCDPVAAHLEWAKDVVAYAGVPGHELAFPMIADEDRSIAAAFGMLDPLERDGQGLPLPSRAVFLIGPDRRIRFTIIYPAMTGRSFSEILRVIDALKLTEKEEVATPAAWVPGAPYLVPQGLSEAEAQKRFPKAETWRFPSKKPYLKVIMP